MRHDRVGNVIKALYLSLEKWFLDYKLNDLLDICSFITIVLTIIVFVIIKKKIKNKEDIFNLYSQFSISEGEKEIAYILYQLIIVCIIINLITSPMVIIGICRIGIASLPRLVCNILFPCINMFLILELIRRVIIGVEKIFDLGNVRFIIRACIFLGGIIYSYQYKELIIQKVTTLKNFNYIWLKILAIFAYIMDRTHFIVSLYLSLVLSVVLIVIIYLLPDRVERDKKIFMNIRYNIEDIIIIQRLVKYNTLLYSYIVNITRRIDTMGMFILTLFAYIMASIVKVNNPIFMVLLLTVISLYTYVQTESIRKMQYIKKYSARKDYLYMIGSQIIYFVIASIPFSIISLIRGDSVKGIILLYFIAIFLINMFMFIGIRFAHLRNNSVMIVRGVFTIFMGGSLLLMVLSKMNISKLDRIVSLIFIMLCFIKCSIVTLEKRNTEY